MTNRANVNLIKENKFTEDYFRKFIFNKCFLSNMDLTLNSKNMENVGRQKIDKNERRLKLWYALFERIPFLNLWT